MSSYDFSPAACFLFWRRPNRVFEITCFESNLKQARNTCESKQAKQRQCLPRERLVQGKKHAGKKALLAEYLIPLLRSQKPCNKKKNTIPNSAGMKKLKAMNMLKQRKVLNINKLVFLDKTNVVRLTLAEQFNCP